MNLVVPNGNAPARVMIVGDYPTETEVSHGKAFAGSTGDSVARLFTSAGLQYNQTWRTHYYKVQLPGWNSPKEKDKTAALMKAAGLADWDALIRQEIHAIKPNLIIAMGELALRGLTGEKNILKRAGSFYPLKPALMMMDKPIRVLAVHSPRHLYVAPEEKILTRMDLRKGLPFVEHAPPWKDDYNLVIGDKPNYVRDWIKHFSRGAQFGVFDVETSLNLVTCICFCYDGKNSMSVPLLSKDYSPETRAMIWYLVYYTLIGQVPWVNQNIKYDMNRLEAMKFRIGQVIGDTMLRASVIYPELPKGLDFLTRLYTNVGYYKDEGKEYDPKIHDFRRMLLYNAKDGITTHRVYTAQEKDIKALGLDKINAKVQRAFFIYRRMEDNGILIDMDELARLKAFYDREIWILEATLNTVAGRKINAKSGLQLGPLLIELGASPKIQVWDETKGKFKYKTGKVELEDMFVNVSDKPDLAYIARLAIAIRKMYKLRQFCDFIPIRESYGYVARTSYKLHGTETGRSATGKLLEAIWVQLEGEDGPSWEQPGLSMQQQPKHPWEYDGREYGKEFRKIFIPRPGRVLIEFDLSQAEARVVDVLAEDYESLDEYGKIDKHCKTAAIVNQLDYDDLFRRHKAGDPWAYAERQKGKTYKHASNYDESPYNLSRRSHVPYKQCESALRNIAAANPKTRNIFHRTVREAIDRNRTLVTPFGRVRTFFGDVTPKLYKEAYASVPQSTIPDHLRFNMLFPLEEKFGNEVNFLVEWHDSLLAEVPIALKDDYIHEVREAAKTPILFREGTFKRNYELRIPVDCGIGYNWLDIEKVK